MTIQIRKGKVNKMANKSTDELKALIVKFYALNPTDEQIEVFYTNEILPHDKRSIVEIMGNLYKQAHPNFQMPEGVQIPDGFEDISYQNDEYPSWTLKRDWKNGHKLQFWIAYDHGYDNGTWEDLEEMGIYQLSTTHDDRGIDVLMHDRDLVSWTAYKTFPELLKAIDDWKEKEESICDSCGEYIDDHLPEINCPNEKEGE